MSIAENLARVRERIARAAEASGRSPGDVTLVGVTKYVRAADAAELVAAGCADLGESRPQELWKKADELAGDEPRGDIRWHLIGHLQRNKVRRTLPLVELIHGVDSRRLLEAIQHEADGLAAAGETLPRPVRVLLEVNTSGEAVKHGLAADEVEPLVAIADRFPSVSICGLMTMAALAGGPAVAARNFASLRELRDRLRTRAADGVQLDELSMGMSGDFEEAIAAGATIVRVGTALWE
jgi:hypothetical protein